MNQDVSSYEGQLPNREPQCPRKPISAETADKDSTVGRNDVPYNEGSESHMRGADRVPPARD